MTIRKEKFQPILEKAVSDISDLLNNPMKGWDLLADDVKLLITGESFKESIIEVINSSLISKIHALKNSRGIQPPIEFNEDALRFTNQDEIRSAREIIESKIIEAYKHQSLNSEIPEIVELINTLIKPLYFDHYVAYDDDNNEIVTVHEKSLIQFNHSVNTEFEMHSIENLMKEYIINYNKKIRGEEISWNNVQDDLIEYIKYIDQSVYTNISVDSQSPSTSFMDKLSEVFSSIDAYHSDQMSNYLKVAEEQQSLDFIQQAMYHVDQIFSKLSTAQDQNYNELRSMINNAINKIGVSCDELMDRANRELFPKIINQLIEDTVERNKSTILELSTVLMDLEAERSDLEESFLKSQIYEFNPSEIIEQINYERTPGLISIEFQQKVIQDNKALHQFMDQRLNQGKAVKEQVGEKNNESNSKYTAIGKKIDQLKDQIELDPSVNWLIYQYIESVKLVNEELNILSYRMLNIEYKTFRNLPAFSNISNGVLVSLSIANQEILEQEEKETHVAKTAALSELLDSTIQLNFIEEIVNITVDENKLIQEELMAFSNGNIANVIEMIGNNFEIQINNPEIIGKIQLKLEQQLLGHNHESVLKDLKVSIAANFTKNILTVFSSGFIGWLGTHNIVREELSGSIAGVASEVIETGKDLYMGVRDLKPKMKDGVDDFKRHMTSYLKVQLSAQIQKEIAELG